MLQSNRVSGCWLAYPAQWFSGCAGVNGLSGSCFQTSPCNNLETGLNHLVLTHTPLPRKVSSGALPKDNKCFPTLVIDQIFTLK